MKTNIFTKILRLKKADTSRLSSSSNTSSLDASVETSTIPDDETVITNFTDSYLEAYFDGELQTLEERQLEGVLGERYVQEEMIKRGELRNIISSQSKLSIPSAHDLKQEKKRVWNNLEHELRLSLAENSQNSSKKAVDAYKSSFSASLVRSFAAGSACLVVGIVYLNFSSNEKFSPMGPLASVHSASGHSSSGDRDYVLVHPREIREMVRQVRDDYASNSSGRTLLREPVGGRELEEFERHNALIANLNSDELSDLGGAIVRNEGFNSNLLTFVSNQRVYE